MWNLWWGIWHGSQQDTWLAYFANNNQTFHFLASSAYRYDFYSAYQSEIDLWLIISPPKRWWSAFRHIGFWLPWRNLYPYVEDGARTKSYTIQVALHETSRGSPASRAFKKADFPSRQVSVKQMSHIFWAFWRRVRFGEEEEIPRPPVLDYSARYPDDEAMLTFDFKYRPLGAHFLLFLLSLTNIPINPVKCRYSQGQWHRTLDLRTETRSYCWTRSERKYPNRRRASKCVRKQNKALGGRYYYANIPPSP